MGNRLWMGALLVLAFGVAWWALLGDRLADDSGAALWEPLFAQAQSRDEAARHAAFLDIRDYYQLGHVPPERLVQHVLSPVVGEGSPELTRWALRATRGRLGNKGEDVVRRLRTRLEHVLAGVPRHADGSDWETEVTGLYAGALAEAGPAGSRVLLELLQGDDQIYFARRQAATALLRYGPSNATSLLHAMSVGNFDTRRAVAESVLDLPVRTGVTRRVLAGVVSFGCPLDAHRALKRLAASGEGAVSALGSLITRLDTDNERLRTGLAKYVAKVAGHDPARLVRAYKTGSVAMQRGIVEAVAHLEPLPAPFVALLRTALSSFDQTLRLHAALLLTREGHLDGLPLLTDALGAEQGQPRIYATSALAPGGRAAAHLLPRMVRRLERLGRYEREDRPVAGGRPAYRNERHLLRHTVSRLGVHNLPLMVGCLVSGKVDLESAAEDALGEAGTPAYRLLEEAWFTFNTEQRVVVAALIGPALTRRGKVTDGIRAAVHELARLGMADPDSAVRRMTFSSIYADGSLLYGKLGALVGLLWERDKDFTFDAAYRLYHLGAKAAPVEAELEAFRDHPHRLTRIYIRKTLDRIANDS